MKRVYPVIFTKTPRGYLIEAPDLEVRTQGKDIADAIEMARDAISLKCVVLEDDGEPIPEPSPAEKIDVSAGLFAEEGRGVVSLVDVDTAVYRRMIDNRSVRRNVALPNWLNCAAERAKLNVSKVLQDALMRELDIKRA